MTQRFTAIIEREDDTYVALCPELDIASQGETVFEARSNLRKTKTAMIFMGVGYPPSRHDICRWPVGGFGVSDPAFFPSSVGGGVAIGGV